MKSSSGLPRWFAVSLLLISLLPSRADAANGMATRSIKAHLSNLHYLLYQR